ncbi:MAG: stress response translation initiation inhibitor YciH [Candidatus Hodarchaeota archaeon]
MCKVCGLPQELCVCAQIAKEEQRIRVFCDKRKWGRMSTIIEGINEKDVDLNSLAKELKTKLACGGTVKDNRIELQGDHREKILEILAKMGYEADNIDIR